MLSVSLMLVHKPRAPVSVSGAEPDVSGAEPDVSGAEPDVTLKPTVFKSLQMLQ